MVERAFVARFGLQFNADNFGSRICQAGNIDFLNHGPGVVLQAGVPDIQAERAGWRGCAEVQRERYLPLLVGLSDGAGVSHNNERLHVVVNITPELNNAGLIKQNGCFGHARIELEIKGFSRREGVDMMLGVVTIRKVHAGPDRKDQYMRVKHSVFLKHFGP